MCSKQFAAYGLSVGFGPSSCERHWSLRTRGRGLLSGCFLQYHAHHPRDKRLVQPAFIGNGEEPISHGKNCADTCGTTCPSRSLFGKDTTSSVSITPCGSASPVWCGTRWPFPKSWPIISGPSTTASAITP